MTTTTRVRRVLALLILAVGAIAGLAPAATAESGTADLAEHGAWLEANPAIAEAMANPIIPELPAKAAQVARPVHWGITAPNYDVCAWTGVRDGVLGYGGPNVLTEYYSFWYVDHYWTFCSARLSWAGDFHCWIVSRHDGYTLHLGAC
jgi:hypothetical protein